MKRITQASILVATLLAFWLVGCSVDNPGSVQVKENSGERVFLQYVAVGNSLTAGYMDAGLHVAGQHQSYPALIAQKMGFTVEAGPHDDFYQPYVNDPGIGSTSTGDPSQVAGVVYWTGTSIALTGTTPIAEVPTLLLAATVPVPYNNLGIPGAYFVNIWFAKARGKICPEPEVVHEENPTNNSQ